MARKRSNEKTDAAYADYRYEEKRKNIPPAGLAAQGVVREKPKVKYSYDPHLPPELRFDVSGGADRIRELIEAAQKRILSEEEAKLLMASFRKHEPWLEWAGKKEKREFEVDPVALHIHERISAQAILKIAARENAQRELFADPQLEYTKAVQFYQHDIDWTNRMILGDSLQVMTSLAIREGLAGKVQMIYVDPPYGDKVRFQFSAGDRQA